jgi:hypothetical protein
MDRNRIGKCLLILLAAVCPITLTAQNSVTPIIMPTPAGQLITANNGPGNHSDPHVSGDLVSYSGRNRGQEAVKKSVFVCSSKICHGAVCVIAE